MAEVCIGKFHAFYTKAKHVWYNDKIDKFVVCDLQPCPHAYNKVKGDHPVLDKRFTYCTKKAYDDQIKRINKQSAQETEPDAVPISKVESRTVSRAASRTRAEGSSRRKGKDRDPDPFESASMVTQAEEAICNETLQGLPECLERWKREGKITDRSSILVMQVGDSLTEDQQQLMSDARLIGKSIRIIYADKAEPQQTRVRTERTTFRDPDPSDPDDSDHDETPRGRDPIGPSWRPQRNRSRSHRR